MVLYLFDLQNGLQIVGRNEQLYSDQGFLEGFFTLLTSKMDSNMSVGMNFFVPRERAEEETKKHDRNSKQTMTPKMDPFDIQHGPF